MSKFLDKTGLNSLWKRIKKALPFVDVSVSGDDNGWCKVAVITCSQTYMNRPFVFYLLCRGFPASSAEIMFASQNGTTPGVLYFIHRTTLLEANFGKSSNVGYTFEDVDGVRVYTLWKKKNERYGTISVHAECIDDFAKYVTYPKGISYTEPEGIVYADERYDHVKKMTAYSAKGSSTKIPQVTTNAAGQVTTIDEVDLGNAPTATKPVCTLLTGTDNLDLIMGSGKGDVLWYYWAAGSGKQPQNARSTASAVMEVVRTNDGNYCCQTVYESNQTHVWRRVNRNGTWDLWYRYAKSSTTLSGYGITNAYTKTEVDGLLDNKLDTDGDGSSLTETFTAASSRANIASGESNATIFGKIAKWLSDLKALAFKDAVSDSDISGTISDNHIASASTWNGKVDRVVVTDLADWDSLTETGIYEIESQAPGVEHSPESGRMTLIVINSDGYIVQFALGHSTFRREHPRNNSFGAWLSFPQLSASAIQLQLLYIDATGVINSSGIYTQDLHNVVYYPGAYVVGTLFSSVGHGTTYGFVGLYSDKSNDTPALQPSNPNTGDLAGDLNAIVYRNYGANVWSPTARGAKDFLIYIQSGGTKNFLFKDIIEHAPTARRFRLTFINYSTVLTPIRFCYDSNYNNGIEIFTNFGRAGTDTPVNYWLVDVPVNRSVAVDVSINYNSNSDVWVAALNITNDQRTM